MNLFKKTPSDEEKILKLLSDGRSRTALQISFALDIPHKSVIQILIRLEGVQAENLPDSRIVYKKK